MAENFETVRISVQSRDQLPLAPDPVLLENPLLTKWFQDFTNWARRLGVLAQIGSGSPIGEGPPTHEHPDHEHPEYEHPAIIVGDPLKGGIHGHEFPEFPTDNGVYWLKLTITGTEEGDKVLEWGETVEGCSDCGS